MKKRIMLILSCLMMCLTVGAGIVFASWYGNNKTENNTITIGTFVKLTLTKSPDDTIDNIDNGFEATYKVHISDIDTNVYDLVFSGILFYDEDSKEDRFAYLGSVWEYSFDDEEWVDLNTTATLIQDAKNGDEITLLLRVKQGAPDEYAFCTLALSVKLEVRS